MTKNISMVVVLFLVLSLIGTYHYAVAQYGPPSEQQYAPLYFEGTMVQRMLLSPPASGTMFPCTLHCVQSVHLPLRGSQAKGYRPSLPAKRGPPLYIFHPKLNCSIGAVLFFFAFHHQFSFPAIFRSAPRKDILYLSFGKGVSTQIWKFSENFWAVSAG